MAIYSPEPFRVSFVAEWFHFIPHIDITFSSVNATFDPASNAYLEALGIIIAVPGFWLILTLLAFLIFFLCRCCDTGFKKKKKLTPLKWALCIFAILCGGALAVGIYGNDQSHNGVNKVETSTKDMQDILLSLKNKTTVIESTLKDEISPKLDILTDLFNQKMANATVKAWLKQHVNEMKDNVTTGVRKTGEINQHMDKFRLPAVPQTIAQVEIIRWPVTIGLLCLLIVFCLILFWGVIRHSRCLLILFSVLGLLSVVICWVLVSLYIGICVAGSDFCLDPEPFIYEQANGIIETSILSYYLHCGKVTDPFENAKKEGRKAVVSVESTLGLVSSTVDKFLPQPEQFFDVQKVKEVLRSLRDLVNSTDHTIQEMQALLDCQMLHKEYDNAMEATCTDVLEGTAFMLVSAIGGGLLFTILIWLSSHTWIHIRKKRQTEHVDEEDPFLPHSNGARRNRDTNGRSGSREDPTFLQGRYTPPPAYDQLNGRHSRGDRGLGNFPPYKPQTK